MYRYYQPKATTIEIKNNQQLGGQSMEEKIRRALNNKEPIQDVSERIYTERKDGVLPEYDIRTDRWEIAIDGMDAITKANLAKREERIKGMTENLDQQNKEINSNKNDNGGPESTAGTDSTK